MTMCAKSKQYLPVPETQNELFERWVKFESKILTAIERLDDHEQRVRELEASKNRIIGGLIAVSAFVSVMAFVIGYFSYIGG